MSLLLLDTGPIVAVLDRHDSHHDWVTKRLDAIRGRIITTGPVITEAAFFLQDLRGGVSRLAALLKALRAEIWDCFASETMEAAGKCMTAYLDTPMDFADATLVLAAERFGVGNIATLDIRGFSAFRFGRNRSFRLVLQESET